MLILSLLFGSEKVYPQGSTLIAHSPKNQSLVQLKWYDQDFLKGSFNIYRKEQGIQDWIKLNADLIERKRSVGLRALENDPDLSAFIEFVSILTEEDLEEDLILFNVLLKTFQSNDFADYLGVFYEDNNTRIGINYEYKVTRVSNSSETEIGEPILVTTGAGTGLEEVPEVAIKQEGHEIHINWLPDNDRFYGVNIYRRSELDSGEVKLNANPLVLSQKIEEDGSLTYPDPMYKDDSLLQNTNYTYFVRGLGYFENETDAPPINIFFKDILPPTAPFELRGKADTMKVHLHWKSQIESDFIGYFLYRSTLSDGPFERVNAHPFPVETLHYIDTLTIPGPYYYYVSSIDESENEGNSDPIFVEVQDVIPPAMPKGLIIKSDTGKLHLKWSANSEPDLAGYLLYRTIDKDDPTNYVVINAEPLADTVFTQVIPKNVKNEIYFKIVAIDTSFNRSPYSEKISAVLPDVTPPNQPQIYRVVPSDQNVIVEWVANVDADLARYDILRSVHSDSIGDYKQINTNPIRAQSTRFIDRNVNPDVTYSYVLQAMDSTGNTSLWSLPHKILIKPIKDSENPTALRLRYNKRRQQSLITWKYPQKDDLLGFVVFRGNDQENLRPLTGILKEQFFTDSQLTDTLNYFYQIRSYDRMGAVGRSEVIEWNSNDN